MRFVLSVLAVAAMLTPAFAADADANKELYRRFMEEVWNKRNPSAVDRYLSPDYVEHNPNLPPGIEGRKQFVATVQAAFSDYHAEIEEVVAEGDRVVARVLWTGTQDGPFQGRPPTHNKLRFSTSDFFRIADGKIAEHWDVVDRLPRMIALGLLPPTALAPNSTGQAPAKP